MISLQISNNFSNINGKGFGSTFNIFAQETSTPTLSNSADSSSSLRIPLGQGFRNALWGDSQKEVIRKQGKAPFGSDSEIVVYQDSVAGLKCSADYTFVDDKLVAFGYVFSEPHSDLTKYISDFSAIQKSLKSKYGEPEMEKKLWANDLYKDDQNNWGMAIAKGHLSYYSSWHKDGVFIWHALSGDNYQINHLLLYNPEKYEKLRKERNEKKEAEKL